MNQKIQIASIVVLPDRQRKDMGDLAYLTASIKARGVIVPLVLSRSNELIAGERRLRASKAAGLTEVPFVYYDEADEITREEIELEENICRKDLSDTEKSEAIQRIHRLYQRQSKNWKVADTASKLGMSTGAISMYVTIAEEKAKSSNVGEVLKKHGVVAAYKEVQNQRISKMVSLLSKKAEVEVKNTSLDPRTFYIKGESTDLIKLVPSESIDLVFTDPPYRVNVNEMSYWDSQKAGEIVYDDSPESVEKTFSLLYPELLRVMKPDSFVFFWSAYSIIEKQMAEFRSLGLSVAPVPFFWCKDLENSYTPNPEQQMASAVEFGVYAWKGKPRLAQRGKVNFIVDDLPKHNKLHPHEKPLYCQQALIERFVIPGSTVLDPFAGSGSALKAALKAKMKPLGFEREDKYYSAGSLAMIEFLKGIKA